MKKGWIITILFVLLLIAAVFIGRLTKKCSVNNPVNIPVDYQLILDSLHQIQVYQDVQIDSLKKELTKAKTQYEKEKKPIVVEIDSINNDSIPAVFLRLSDYYSK
jgi:biopolymer transport protein ExbD